MHDDDDGDNMENSVADCLSKVPIGNVSAIFIDSEQSE
jgi:hypothetical protein